MRQYLPGSRRPRDFDPIGEARRPKPEMETQIVL
jgi:hypothetical protein